MGSLHLFRHRDEGRHAGRPYDPWLPPAGPGFDQAATEAIDTVRDEPRQDAPQAQVPAPRVFPLAADYRALPVFRTTVRAACAAGLTGLGTRGVHPVIPVPDYGLERFTTDSICGIWAGDIGREFDEVAARAEAGFYEARRVFHSADTAGFPAVTA